MIWWWHPLNAFTVGNAYVLMNRRGVFKEVVWAVKKTLFPMKVKVFIWHFLFQWNLMAKKLIKSNWSHPQCRAMCGLEPRSRDHFFITCNSASAIGTGLLVPSNYCERDLDILEICSGQPKLQGWSICESLCSLWCLWLKETLEYWIERSSGKHPFWYKRLDFIDTIEELGKGSSFL